LNVESIIRPRFAQKSAESFAALPPSVRKGCAFPESRTLASIEAIASVDAEADSLDLRFDSAHGKPQAFRTDRGKAAIEVGLFVQSHPAYSIVLYQPQPYLFAL
jgi:hypothetical protein